MRMILSRRSLIGAGLLLTAAGVAGCSKAVRTALTVTSTPPGTPISTPPPTATSTVGSNLPGPAPSTSSTGLDAVTAGPASTGPASTVPASTPPSGPAVEIAHGPRDKPRVALTFHGAGDSALARQILTIVGARGARITVLAVGTWLADNPMIAGEILAGGHLLGNHTWSHQDINSMAEAEMRQEVTRCRDLLIQTTGSAGAYFRPSQTPTANDLMKQVAGDAGYAISLSYDVDSLDYTDPGAAAIRQNMTAAAPGSIVSMHLGHQDTVDALPGVLDDLAARGLTAVTVSDLLAG